MDKEMGIGTIYESLRGYSREKVGQSTTVPFWYTAKEATFKELVARSK
jgi:hypothetical protein